MLGIDAAGPIKNAGNLQLLAGRLEDYYEQLPCLELIISINTLEHLPNPVGVLETLSTKLHHDGLIILVVPQGNNPNLELLFRDHLSSFSQSALGELAKNSNLTFTSWKQLPFDMGDFQLAIFRKQGKSLSENQGSHQVDEKNRYLQSWLSLDHLLTERIQGEKCLMFGAGQMAALIRCYCPNTWNQVSHLIMDNPDSGWGLKNVGPVPREFSTGQKVLIGVHPKNQAMVAQRVVAQNGFPIRFDDHIER